MPAAPFVDPPAPSESSAATMRAFSLPGVDHRTIPAAPAYTTMATRSCGGAPASACAATEPPAATILPDWELAHLREGRRGACDGWIRDTDFGAPVNALYVNRGIGFSRVPVRINCLPEWMLLALRRAPTGT